MQNIFSVTSANGHWWEGTLSVRYNLLAIVKLIGGLLALAAALFGLYWLGIGLWALLGLIWDGMCWLGTAIWSGLCWLAAQWLWILGAALLALVIWLFSRIKLPEWDEKDDNDKRSWKWLRLLLLALLLGGCIFLLFKSCDGSEPEPKPQPEVVTPERFDEAFDWVVTTRAYLDGVQNGDTKAEVALVGLKFVNGESVTKMSFQNQTYEEAVDIIAADWRGLVADNVHVQLTDNQLIALTLFAMRNGKYGFLKSDFLRNVNNGNFSAEAMALHDAKGNKRELGAEGLQYLWVLKNLWDGNISAKELLDYPMFSYKAISLKEMYSWDHHHLFSDELADKLLHGSFKTPREALDLDLD